MNNTFKKGDMLTVIGISSFMATTTMNTYKATGATDGSGKPIFTENKKGARKKFTLRPFDNQTLAFIGDIPFTTDGNAPEVRSSTGMMVRTFRGNACINLVGDAGTIVYYILKANINPNFTAYDYVIHIDGDKETPLFPEVPTSHAVVQGIRAAVTN